MVCSFDKSLSKEIVIYRGKDEYDNVAKEFIQCMISTDGYTVLREKVGL